MKENLSITPVSQSLQVAPFTRNKPIAESQLDEFISSKEAQEIVLSARQNYELELVRLEKIHSDLFTAKQALTALQAEHKAKLADFKQKAAARRQELEQALVKLKASIESELSELQSEFAQEVAEAEKVILQHRQRFLAAQKQVGKTRRNTDLVVKETHIQLRNSRAQLKNQEKEMEQEWRENSAATISALRRKLIEIKMWKHRIEKFREDVSLNSSLQDLAKPQEQRIKLLTEENQMLYHSYALAGESFESFVSRHLQRFESLNLETRLQIADSKVNSAYRSKISAAGPVMLDPEEAKHIEKPVSKTRARKLIDKYLGPVKPKNESES